MKSLSEQAQRFSRSLGRRIPAFVSLAKFMHSARLFFYKTAERVVNIAKKSITLTGPVMTLLDLVVHVPVNCGSVCADIEYISSALAASDDRSDTIMKYGVLESK